MKKLSFLYALVLVFTPVTHAETSTQQEISALLGTFLERVNDIDVHRQFWADNLIYTSSSGTRFGKDVIINGMATDNGDPSVARYGAENITIQDLGDVALLTFELTRYDSAESTEISQRYFNTGVFVVNDGRWQATVWQATKAAPID